MAQIRYLAFLSILALFLGVSNGAALANESVRISVPADNATFGYFFVAVAKGYFSESGLDVQSMEMSGGIATPALISGSTDYSLSPSSAMSAIMKGAQMRIVMVTNAHPTEQLWSFDPAVKTFAGLKDKLIAVGSRGGTEEIAIRMYLIQHNLPIDFVGLSAMNTSAIKAASVVSGSQKFAMLNLVDRGFVEKAGATNNATLIVDFPKVLFLTNGGLVTTSQELATHHDRAMKVMAALRKGTLYMLSHRDETVSIMQKVTPNVAREQIAADVDDAIRTTNVSGRIPDGDAENELKVRAAILGVPPGDIPQLSGVFDFSLEAAVTRDLRAWKPGP